MPRFSVDTAEVQAAASGVASVADQIASLNPALAYIEQACVAMNGGLVASRAGSFSGSLYSLLSRTRTNVNSLQTSLGLAVTNYDMADAASNGGG